MSRRLGRYAALTGPMDASDVVVWLHGLQDTEQAFGQRLYPLDLHCKDNV